LLAFVSAKGSNMNDPQPANGEAVPNPLNAEQQALLAELQQAFAAGHEEIPEDLYERITRAMPWSWDDQASLDRAAYFMAHDPYYRREARLIDEDFARATLSDLKERE
jgi:hypothetical protein